MDKSKKNSAADRPLKFVPCERIPPYYHDHSTHSSCRAGGELVYDRVESEVIGIHEFCEIGAIHYQLAMWTNERGDDSVSGCVPVFKANPRLKEQIGGGLTPKMLREIAARIEGIVEG